MAKFSKLYISLDKVIGESTDWLRFVNLKTCKLILLFSFQKTKKANKSNLNFNSNLDLKKHIFFLKWRRKKINRELVIHLFSKILCNY